MRRAVAFAAVVALTCPAPEVSAQTLGVPATTPTAPSPLADASKSTGKATGDDQTTRGSSTVGSTFKLLPPVNEFNFWAGSSVATLTASDNEYIRGSMTIVGIQWTHDLFEWRGARFSWVTEGVPLMLVSSSAPPLRIPAALRDPRTADPARLALYLEHDSYGFGISPLSAQSEIPLSRRWSTIVQVTSGVAWFSNVVPYGRATQANFTVNPSLALQWRAGSGTRLSFGYTLHHLSNASFGGSNPGMNSHMFLMRVTR